MAARWRAGAMPALAAVVVALAACTTEPSNAGSTTTTIPEAKTVLHVAAADWPDCVNPLVCNSEAARNLVFEHVLPRLFEIDGRGGHVPSPLLDGEPTSVLDGETGQQRITYRLKAGAHWHDGRPITSSDIVGTWHAMQRTPGSTRAPYNRVVAIDDTDPTVAVVTLDGPDADWRELFGGYTGWLLEADAFGADTDLTGEFATELPFGAGPFELVAFDEDSIVLAAVDEPWDSARTAAIDQIRIERVPSGAELPPDIDIVIPDEELAGGVPGLEARAATTASVLGIFFDQRTEALADVAVRTAIDDGIDRRNLLALTGESGETASLVTCLGWLPTDPSCGAVLAESDNDPVAADELLTAAGWPSNADGLRARGGAPFVVPVTYDPAIPRLRAVADAVRLSLGALGATVEQSALSHTTWASPVRTDSTGIGIFTIELGTPGRAAALYTCPPGTRNVIGWCDVEIGNFAAQVRASVDPDGRREAGRQLDEAVAPAEPWLPLRQITQTWYVAADRISVPEEQPLAGGPLGALYEFERLDG